MAPEMDYGIGLAPLPPAKIIIAGDYPLVCAGLLHVLRSAMPGGTVWAVPALGGLEAAIGEYTELDLALLDLPAPGVRGASSLVLLRAQRPQLPVIVICAEDDPAAIARAQRLGAAGFLSKSAPVSAMLRAIDTVLRGSTCFPRHTATPGPDDASLATRLRLLTPQQMRVLVCVADGLLNKQIARQLGLAENTVKVHVTAVLHKLGCQTRTRAAVLLKALEAQSASQAFPKVTPLAAARAPQPRRMFSESPRQASGAGLAPRPR